MLLQSCQQINKNNLCTRKYFVQVSCCCLICVCNGYATADFSDWAIRSLLAISMLFCLLPIPVVSPSQSALAPKVCVCVASSTWVFIWAYLVCVMGYWSSPAEVAGPQVRSIKTTGNLSWEQCISLEPPDWLLPGGGLPWWRIRS